MSGLIFDSKDKKNFKIIVDIKNCEHKLTENDSDASVRLPRFFQ